jgi:putative two-component system response regulator
VAERILVVDDDAQMRRLLARLLAADGFACEAAGTADAARRAIAEREPELVLLDVGLPDESGLSLARAVAASHPRVRVVMVSGQDDAGVAQTAFDAGAYGYVTKPFKRNEVAIAVRSALRRREVALAHQSRRETLEDDAVQRLSEALRFRDEETGSHVERMSHYCALLARRFGLDPEAMRTASRLHDAGKIAVADSILHKPGPLTDDERAEMQRHAEVGHRLLRGSSIELLDLAAEIALTHHERFDGTGYPRGLRGEEIPLCGRIAGVADCFDALTSDRVYRPALPVSEAVALLASERGRHFDPTVVDAFLDELGAAPGPASRPREPVPA